MAEVSVAGTGRWLLRDDLDELQHSNLATPQVRLLPNFDPWVLGHADKQQLVAQQAYKRIFRSAGWIAPVVLVNGRAAGVWSSQRQGKVLLVAVEAFERYSKAVRTLVEAEAARLGAYHQLPVRIVFST